MASLGANFNFRLDLLTRDGLRFWTNPEQTVVKIATRKYIEKAVSHTVIIAVLKEIIDSCLKFPTVFVVVVHP
jgi:hypothetical protein